MATSATVNARIPHFHGIKDLSFTNPSSICHGKFTFNVQSQLCTFFIADFEILFPFHLQYDGSKLKVPLKFRIQSKTRAQPGGLIIRCDHPQNADFPRYYSKKQRKPFPIPIVELRRATRERLKNRKGQPQIPVLPPKNGLLVENLIPVAYSVMNARVTLINNLKKLLRVVPVQACTYCNAIHVGPLGHPFKSCRGQQASVQKGIHEWTRATVDDIFLPIEAYHLFDRLGKRIPHEKRFSIPRIPALVELCIQAGVDIPEFPTKRRRKPIIRVNKSEFIDADESELPDPQPQVPKEPLVTELPNWEIIPPANPEETALLAEATLETWEELRQGTLKLMKKYAVRVCGYCPEIHVGPSGHRAQNCGAHKHQQRNGQHGWQSAVLDDLIPPRYVWHVPEDGQPLHRELRNFYGQAPAVVEICVQGGAAVPEQYKPTMRLEIGIPADPKEAEMVV
ncbi:APO domain [Dillenia turbinata]|uniref:APO domain n=1 Tax=Dillenia turbinata TaxID=194707 RepID=A0AAN8ZNY4_9MAGN